MNLSQKASASQTPARGPTRSVPNGHSSQVPVEGYIQEVSGSGTIITLSDGSIWKVSPLNQVDTALWLPVTDVRIVAGDDPSYPYKMINKDDGEVANVELLSY